MAACTPSIHVILGRPLFLLSHDIQSVINIGILSSGIRLTWPFHCSIPIQNTYTYALNLADDQVLLAQDHDDMGYMARKLKEE